MAFHLLGVAEVLAAEDRILSIQAFEIPAFEGKLTLGEHTYKTSVPTTDPMRIIESPTAVFFAEVARDIRQGRGKGGALGLDWSRVESSAIPITASSQLTLIAMDLINTGPDSDFLLEISGSHAVAWYYEDAQGSTVVYADDVARPRLGRQLFDSKPVMSLHLEPLERYRIIICAYVLSQGGLVALDLWEPEAFRAQRTQQNLLDGVYFGVAIAIVIANLVLGIALRQSVYVFFSLLVASTACTISLGSGLTVLYLDPPALVIPLFLISLAMTSIFSVFVCIKLFDIEKTHRKLYYFYLGFTGYTLMSGLVASWFTGGDPVPLQSVDFIFLLGLTGFALGHLGHLYALIYYARRSPIAVPWYLCILAHSWALILWAILIGSPVDASMDRRYLVQFTMLLDLLMLLGLMIYGYKSEENARREAQQRALESLRMAHDLERSRASFVATVGHDLRGPVQAISHFAQSLKGKPPDDSALASALRKIDHNVEAISDLLDSMVTLSKIEWQATVPKLEPVQLKPLLSELKGEFSTATAARDLSLEFDVTPCAVLSDRICLGQVLRNLIDNAIKYTQHGYVKVLIEVRDETVRIVVEDSGRGIREDELEKIFGEFYRSAESDQEVAGIGLGLSIVARLTRILGIEVTVSSEYGVGSRFELDVPKVGVVETDGAHSNDTAMSSAVSRSLSGARILVVGREDQVGAISSLLHSWKARVDHLGSFNDVIESQGFAKPDLVLTDASTYASVSSALLASLRQDVTLMVALPEGGSAERVECRDDRHLFVDQAIAPMKLRSLIQRYVKVTAISSLAGRTGHA